MRICKGDFGKHGMYAEVMGLTDTPTGVKARLKFPDGSRENIVICSPISPANRVVSAMIK